MQEQIDVLAIGAHPDDVELSAGGTLAKLAAEGKKTGILDLTNGQLGTRGTEETRKVEAQNAAKILGLSFRESVNMQDGYFVNDAAHRELVIQQIRRLRPEIVLCNARFDRHPDHGRGAELVREACFYSGLKKIATSFNGEPQEAHRPRLVLHYIQDYTHEPDIIIDITGHSETKVDSILAYETQFFNPNSQEPSTPISTPEFLTYLKNRSVEWGRRMGVEHGEGFTCERPLGVNSIFDLM